MHTIYMEILIFIRALPIINSLGCALIISVIVNFTVAMLHGRVPFYLYYWWSPNSCIRMFRSLDLLL